MIADMLLVLMGTLGVTFAMFGRFCPAAGVDIALRCLYALLAFGVMFVPDMAVSAAIAVVLIAALVAGIRQHHKVAPPKSYAAAPKPGPAAGDLAPVLAEAKRDIG
jgi:hypothetical protein